MAPVILLLVSLFGRHLSTDSQGRRVSKYRTVLGSFPLFIVAFFLVILLNTMTPVPSWFVAPIASGNGEFLGLNAANILLTTAIIGICFRVRRDVLGKSGWKIMITGGVAWGVQSLLVLWLASNFPMPHI